MKYVAELISKNKLNEALEILLDEYQKNPNHFEICYLIQGVYYLNEDYRNCFDFLVKIESAFPNKKAGEVKVLKENCIRNIKNLPKLIYNEDQGFMDTVNVIKDKTVLGIDALFMLYQLLNQTKSMPGDIAQVGGDNGATAYILLKGVNQTEKTVHLLDASLHRNQTFLDEFLKKMNDAIAEDKKEKIKGERLQDVPAFLNEFSNVVVYSEAFSETVCLLKKKTFSLVHIDCKSDSLIKDSCAFFYPRLEKSGILLFDHYGLPSCLGAKRTVDAFFENKIETPVYYPSGQCSVTKL